MRIEVRCERARHCGFRKPGGIYLVTDGLAWECGRLPIPLRICPTCGAGVKQSRGWTWVDADALAATQACRCPASECALCPMSGPMGRSGLLWVGERYYRRPEDWTFEAQIMGVSRRIKCVPHGFEVGKTWVLVAHRSVLVGLGELVPAIFHAFRPSRIEYVVRGSESEAELESLVNRGFTLVDVRRVQMPETAPLFGDVLQ